MRIAIYILSLAVLAISILLILNYPDSNRMNAIAGGVASIGLILNIISFVMQKNNRTRYEFR